MLQTLDISKAEVARQLKRTHHNLDIRTLRFLGAGDFTRAWLVNDELVVRFARHAEAEAAIRREPEMYYFYQLSMIEWVVREIERKGISKAKAAISNLEQLRAEAESEPWRVLCKT